MTAGPVVRLGATAAATAALGVLFLAGSERTARANPMDLAPERLNTCFQESSIPCGEAQVQGSQVVGNYLRADNAAWAKLLSSYAMAMAPNSMRPARTTGYGGFEMSLFGQMTTIDNNASYVEKGTEGPITDSKKFTSRNNSADSMLQVWGVTGRKGLPYGFELQGTVGYMANTELVILGGGIRLSPFEGFRKYIDISAGGYVHTLTGTAKVKVTVPAFDVAVSRRFAIASTVIFQPYVGWQMLWINADSGVVDTTPHKDGLGACNARPATQAERDAGDSGEFHCQQRAGTGLVDAPNGSSEALAKLDLNNNVVFQNMRQYRRQRLFAGLAWRWENLSIILPHVMYDLIDPSEGAPGGTFTDNADYDRTTGQSKTKDNSERLKGMAKQWTFGATVGLAW